MKKSITPNIDRFMQFGLKDSDPPQNDPLEVPVNQTTERDDLSEIPENPTSAIVKGVNAIEINGHLVTREKLEKMENAAKRIKISAFILDSLGVEALVGILTGAGDVGGAMLSLHPVIEATALGYPKEIIHKMLWNLAKDFAVGLIPFVGDIADFFYKANNKNRKLFESHLNEVRAHFADHPEKVTEAQMEGVVALSRAREKSALKRFAERNKS